MYVSKKIQLIVEGDKDEVNRVYQYIRQGMYVQNTAYNYAMSALLSSYRLNQTNEERKELLKMASRKSPSKKGPSLYDGLDLDFPTGMPIAGQVGRNVMQDMNTQIKAGLLKGKISLRTKRLDAPLMIGGKALIKFTTPYENDDMIWENCDKHDFTVNMHFVNNIVFRLVFGNPYRSHELRTTMARILTGEYQHGGGSLQISKGKIFLNLSVNVPQVDVELDDDIVVGCHYGFDSLLTVSCINKTTGEVLSSKAIGNTEAFLQKRLEKQKQRERLQASIAYNAGGHGRKKKLKPLENFKKSEAAFAKTANHQWSSSVVKFAVHQKAKTIILEEVEKDKLDQFVLRNWSYYQFQQFVTYKAKQKGIVVKFASLSEIPEKDTDAASSLAITGIKQEEKKKTEK